MMLSPIDELRETLGFDNMVDVNSAIEAALNSATPTLQAALGLRTLDRAVAVDRFHVLRPTQPFGRSGATDFLLRHGLVDSIDSIVVSRTGMGGGNGYIDADGFKRFVTYADGPDLEDVKARFTFTDLEKGIIQDLDYPYDNAFVTVSYTHGFETDITDATMYEQEKVPDWLKQAARLQALLQFSGSPVVQQAQLKLETRAMRDELNQIVNFRRRYAPLALLPL